jgi:hypothetical protein
MIEKNDEQHEHRMMVETLPIPSSSNNNEDNIDNRSNRERGESTININQNVSDIIRDTDGTFWKQLHAVTNIIKPYSFAPIILESHTATLADAVFVWAQLQLQTENNRYLLDNDALYHHILKRIHVRWKKIYDVMYIIAFYLHPRYFNNGKSIHADTISQIRMAAIKLYVRLFNVQDQREVERFTQQLMCYSGRYNIFMNESIWDDIMTSDPVRFWENLRESVPELSKFAIRILSIPPTSADAERFWSVMSNIHTERRNRLTNEHAKQMAAISWYINREKNQQRRTHVLDKLTRSFNDNKNDSLSFITTTTTTNTTTTNSATQSNNSSSSSNGDYNDHIMDVNNENGDDDEDEDNEDINNKYNEAILNVNSIINNNNTMNNDVDKDEGNSFQNSTKRTLATLSAVGSFVQKYDNEYDIASKETEKVSNNNQHTNSGRNIHNQPPPKKMRRFMYVQVGEGGNDSDYDEYDTRSGLNGILNLKELHKPTCIIS